MKQIKTTIIIIMATMFVACTKKTDDLGSAGTASITGLEVSRADGVRIYESTTVVHNAPGGMFTIRIKGNSTATCGWKASATFHKWPDHTQLVQGLGLQEKDISFPTDQMTISINSSGVSLGQVVEVSLTFTPYSPYSGNQRLVFLIKKT